jgi:PLD-like domain
MSNTHLTTASRSGLTVTAYRGDGSALLGFDLDEHLTKNFAGFAVRVTAPGCPPAYLQNRLSFDKPVSGDSTPDTRLAAWTDSNLAPFQRYRWQHFPKDVTPGAYKYEVTAMYFARKSGTNLEAGPSVEVAINLIPTDYVRLQVGFTRSYVSSQAYATEFGNKELRPGKTLDYNTADYQKQYEFLGYAARKLVFEFLHECLEDRSISVDAFVYDIDEPDIVAALEKLGGRLRIFMDDSPLHTKATALEPQVKGRLEKSAGTSNVKHGHFNRFAHSKVLIQRKKGKPVKVLTGSANFSVRGLYVQANNVLVFDDPDTAGLYGAVFDQVWKDPSTKGFEASKLSQSWSDQAKKLGLPPFEVCFSPHKDPNTSLKEVSDAIDGARSSILFAVMDMGGGGPVMQKLQTQSSNRNVFFYGVTQNVVKPRGKGVEAETTKSVTVHKPGRGKGVVVPFSFLSKNVPLPFRKEIDGGFGQVIHNKFIVVDFNDSNPVVFTGSSNLSQGGEKDNGDNLIAIQDRSIAILYGVQAISLVDHYGFRAALKKATGKPLKLSLNRDNWWQDYYNPKSAKYTERLLFVR